MNIFWGMKILWIFFGGRHKIGLHLGVVSMHCRVFSRYRMGDIFMFRVLEIPIFFFLGGGGVNGRCWARAYV